MPFVTKQPEAFAGATGTLQGLGISPGSYTATEAASAAATG
jgi:hypothetical protein